MEFIPEQVHYEFKRGMYWTRISVKLDSGEGIILMCASKQYITDRYNVSGTIDERHVQRWLADALEEIKKEGKMIRVGGVYKKTYSFTPEGHANAEEFLRGITP
ncbi:MAG: hypothetical protein A2119_01815 [Candidatus Colwellbacteria bacterium GWA2_46_10]|uniref:Uncharacterized protein n=1 Tax=Candidatus Colwellbacteria bacterium GWA2_46_10 TaxID=1797684 RepID=A0A1G1YZC9_9BACT|nr:MAG: hypothetical protein UW86_C0004G0028 [Microgenomates group bacterium GW2011_GWA1_Microgenomates_45_10]KKU18794.1 MAG: hypothetical protein UX29_C0017G0010 [Parcubacteria group bacterium GW2011_GWA2_46_10]OGY56757.1 MAG: hypothetical protein A2119_01815 [Candidatus Colwellbacteria bacterium GWA2_46_10]